MFSLRPHCKAQGHEVWGRAGFWGRLPARKWVLEGPPHLPAGTAVAGTRHGTRQPLAQGLLSAAGAEGSELPPLLLGEAGAVPLLRGHGGQRGRGRARGGGSSRERGVLHRSPEEAAAAGGLWRGAGSGQRESPAAASGARSTAGPGEKRAEFQGDGAVFSLKLLKCVFNPGKGGALLWEPCRAGGELGAAHLGGRGVRGGFQVLFQGTAGVAVGRGRGEAGGGAAGGRLVPLGPCRAQQGHDLGTESQSWSDTRQGAGIHPRTCVLSPWSSSPSSQGGTLVQIQLG